MKRLTPEVLLGRIQDRLKDVHDTGRLTAILRILCGHNGKDSPQTVERRGESAACSYCGEWLGWWCRTSPTHRCDYNEKDPVNDNCIFCGMPEERK